MSRSRRAGDSVSTRYASLEATEEAEANARRNIVVRGYALHQLVGQRFCIGHVTLYGVAAPHLTCASPQPAQQDACAALAGTTLFAQVLTEGDIAPGDRLLILDEVSRQDMEHPGDDDDHGSTDHDRASYHMALSTTLRNGSPAAKRRALSNRT